MELTSTGLNAFLVFNVVLYCSYKLISFLSGFTSTGAFLLQDSTIFSLVTGLLKLLFFTGVNSVLSTDNGVFLGWCNESLIHSIFQMMYHKPFADTIKL